MKKTNEQPAGSWPQFMFNGTCVLGQVGWSGPWFQIADGHSIRFNRHGTFKVTGKLLTFARLTITLPRKGWNSVQYEHILKLPLNKCVTVRQCSYYIHKLNPYDHPRFGHPPK